MSQSPEESQERPETGLVPDEDLPEDLQPDQNPLARDPDDERNRTEDSDGGGSGGPQADGLPDVGQPGTGG